MIKLIGLLYIVFLLGIGNCESIEKECEKTKSPEINFEFLLGGKIYVQDVNTKNNITARFSNVNMMVNKVYCDGTVNGPFEQNYVITTDGTLVRQSIGTWSFRMDNTKDYMNVNFFCEGHDIGTYNFYYEELKKSDGGTAYFKCDISIDYFLETGPFINSKISVSP